MTTARDAIDLIEEIREVYSRRILSGSVANSNESLENRMVAYRAAVNIHNDLGAIADMLRKRIKEEEKEDELPVAEEKKDPFDEEDIHDD